MDRDFKITCVCMYELKVNWYMGSVNSQYSDAFTISEDVILAIPQP